MKNTIRLMLICLIAVLSIASCKKEKTTLQKIQGKWGLATKVDMETINGVTQTETENGGPGDYLDFRTKNTVFLKQGTDTEESAAYTVDNDNQLTFIYDGIDKEVFVIDALTANKFVLHSKRTSAVNTIETIITLTR